MSAWGSPAGQQGIDPAHMKGGLASIPSWLISLVLHAALFIVLAITLPSFRGGLPGDPSGDYRKIGVYVGPSGDGGGGPISNDGDLHPRAKTGILDAPPSAIAPSPSAVPDAPPAELHHSRKPRLVIGPGDPSTESRLISQSLMHLPPSTRDDATGGESGKGRGASGLRGSLGTTPFFGISDAGLKFVYVIDCSSSMYSHDAIQAAKAELAASLRTLKRSQQFQIVFYNTEQKWLTAAGKTEFQFFPATDANRRLAGQFIAEVQPDGGTLHLPALALALRLQPDIIFFLTDGGEPGLSPEEVLEIRRLNNGRSRIHCVEFGVVDDRAAAAKSSFVRAFAAANAGEYVYRDVTRFDRRQ